MKAKSIQQRIRTRLLETQEQPTSRMPLWLRNFARATSGGDSRTAAFVRGVFWKYRWLVVIAVVASLGAGVTEAMTVGVFTLALNQLASQVSATATEAAADTGGALNTVVLRMADFLGGPEPVFVLILLAVSFQLVRGLLDYSGQAASTFLRVRIESDVQRRIFTQLVTLRYQQIVQTRLGNLASYIAQAGEIGWMVQAANQLLYDLMVIAAYVVVLFWLSWQFTLVAVIVLGLLSLMMHRLRESIRHSITGFLNTSVRINERILEYLQAMRLVHIFGREEMVVNDVNRLVNSAIPPRRTAFLRRAMISPLFQSITIVGMAIFLTAGYWAVTSGRVLNLGQLIAYMYVIYRVMPRIGSFNAQLGVIAGQWPFVVRIAELLDMKGKEREYTPGRRIDNLHEAIEFRAVALRYPEGERNALNQLSFRIPKGQMTALVGSSGSGKSSVINLLLGLYRPTSGQILIDGLDLHASDLASWRRLIGVVDQDTLLFSTSIAENIRFGKPDASDDEVMAAAQIANAHAFIQELPQGYHTEVGDRGYKLSGGQRQRIAIARAVIHDPALLLFDEATSALDSHSERLIQESLEELREERTVVVIAHRLSTVTKADEIIVLEAGQIAERGTHQELLSRQGRYAAMWKLQAMAA